MFSIVIFVVGILHFDVFHMHTTASETDNLSRKIDKQRRIKINSLV